MLGTLRTTLDLLQEKDLDARMSPISEQKWLVYVKNDNIEVTLYLPRECVKHMYKQMETYLSGGINDALRQNLQVIGGKR